MSLNVVLAILAGFLLLVVLLMLAGFIVRELSFSRRLDAIREAIMLNSETSAQTVGLVEDALRMVQDNRNLDIKSCDQQFERLREIMHLLTTSVVPSLTRIVTYLDRSQSGSINNFLTQATGSQANQGTVSNPENR